MAQQSTEDRLRTLGEELYARSQTIGNDLGFVKEEGFDPIGAGGGRRVFALPSEHAAEFQSRTVLPVERFVVKFALYAPYDRIDGRTQNRREMDLSESAPPLFEEFMLPTVGGGEDGFWVVQPYADPIEEPTPEFHETVGRFLNAGYRDELSQTENWGRVNGQLRLTDFGYIQNA